MNQKSYFLYKCLKGQCHENLILTAIVGFRLGPTDVLIEVKRISPSCKPRMCVSVSVSELACMLVWINMHVWVSATHAQSQRCPRCRVAGSGTNIPPAFKTQKHAQSHACVAYTMVKSVLLRWTSSLNDRSKLMGQYIDVKSGFGISVGPSLKPTVSVKTKFSWHCPFNLTNCVLFGNEWLIFIIW